jgi:hypothetical protein
VTAGLKTGGGGWPGWPDTQLHRATVTHGTRQGTTMLPEPGKRTKDAAAGVQLVGRYPLVGEPGDAKPAEMTRQAVAG